MSLQQLKATGNLEKAIVGSTPDGTRLVPLGSSYSWSQQYASTPSNVSLATGNFTSWSWVCSSNDFSMVHDIILQGTAITTDGVNLFTFHNPYFLIQQLKIYLNGAVVLWLQDGFQVESALNTMLREMVSQDPEIYVELQKMMNNANALSGDQITTAGIPVRWSIFNLVPTLKNLVLNASGINRLQFDVTFQPNNSNLSNTMYGASSTASNAYNSSVSYTGLEFNVLFSQLSDPRALAQPSPLLLHFNEYYTFQQPNVSWTNVGTDNYLLQLNVAFPNVTKVNGVSAFIYDNTNSGGAYNSATASQRYSGSQYISYVIRSRGNILYDVSQPTSHLNRRRRYEYDVYKNRNIHASNMPLSVATNSDTLGKYFVKATYIDLSNVIENDNQNEMLLSSRDNLSNDISIQFYCASSLSANCTLYFMLHYNNMYVVKPNGAIAKI